MDGGYPENAIRYFAVLGAEASALAANPANPLPVSVLQRYPLEDHKDCRFPPALASFCFPRGGAQCISSEEEVPDALHGFVLTNEAGDRCFGAALHIWCLHPSGSLVQKALAVVSTQPLWGAFRAFLCSLRASSCPERFIVNFVAETPLPPPGFVVTVALPGFPELALYRPAPNQLPLLDLPVKRMIQQLKPEIVVSLVEALLVEQRIVLHSACISVVCAFCEILVGLIWPLRPAAVYVPLLPDALVDFCGAPLPFVLGIASEMVKRAEAICEPHTLFVNVDTSEVKVTQENSLSISLGMSSGMQGPRPSPPERPHKKLLRRIDLALRGLDFQAEEQKHRFPLPLSRPTTSTPKQRNSSYGLAPAPGSSPAARSRIMSGMSDVTEVGESAPDVSRVCSGALSAKRQTSTDEAHSLDHIMARQGDAAEFESDALIRMAFLWFMTDLLVDHSRFAHERFDGGFDQSGFLSRCSETERPFLKEVTSTQMWASWIGRRINRSKEDSTDVILFDEVIAQKLNRKTFMFNKTATPFLSLDFSARMQESGHYRVAEPPVGEAGEHLSYYSTGTDWHCDESRFYTPRPLPNLQAMLPSMSVPVRKEVERETSGMAKDPLHPSHMAPLVWYLQHCWLLTWAAYLPDRPENTLLQWAKMDLCLAMLHKTGEDHREMPAPHDLALSLLAAACARCGALRVDLARRLFAWMKAKQLGVATHPQSTSVFFERFIQLCASDHGCNGRQVEALPKTGEEAPVSHRNAQGAFGSPTVQADVLLMEDLASRPPVALQVVDGAPKATLVFSGQCARCQGKLTLHEVFSQWSRPGTEETSAVQCPHCRYTGTVQLQITTEKISPVDIDLLHPKRLALSLRGHLDARGHGNEALGPTWLSGLSSAPILWTNLVWYFRSHSFFTEHLLTALAPEKVQNVVEKIVVTLQGRERRVEDGPRTSTELLAPREGPTNSWASVHSRNHSYGGTSIGSEVWDDVELDLPMESPQLAAATAISCTHTLVRRRSRSSLGESSVESRRRPKEVQVEVEVATVPPGPEVFLEVSRVETLQMEKEDLLSQFWRSELRRRHEDATRLARVVLNQVYTEVSKAISPNASSVEVSKAISPNASSVEANAKDLARLVADAAVAKLIVKSMSGMLAETRVVSEAVTTVLPELEPAAPVVTPPEVVTPPSVTPVVARQWIQARPATILTDSDQVSVGSFPCSPAMPLPSSVTSDAVGVSTLEVIKRDSPSELEPEVPGDRDPEKVAALPSTPSESPPPAVQAQPTNVLRKATFGACRPNGTGNMSVNGPSGEVATLTKLKTLEDFLQEADEELKVQQGLRNQEAPGTGSEAVMKDPLDVALAATLVTIPDQDVVEKVKLRPPPLREEVECDGHDVPRSANRDSLPSLPLLSVPDTPLSLAVFPPRRASSAPPERRKRGRGRRLVPMVISTGLATAPTSQIPSPNAVFPTPLLPRERPQASMSHRAPLEPRGRDRRSKSLVR